MTIKICKQKTEDGIWKIGIGTIWLLYIGVVALLPVTIYYTFLWTGNPPDVNFKWGTVLFLGYFFSIMTIVVGEFVGVGIFSKINQKLKLVEWNEDC